MKIKNLKTKKQPLITLTFNKFQVYKNASVYNLEPKFKQILHIISDYHLNKKKILFIGLPYSNNQILFRYSKHHFITKQLLKNYLNENSKLKNISLIVFFNSQVRDFSLLKELHLVKKPLIVLGHSFSFKNTYIGDYVVNLSITLNHLKQFCAFLIYSIIKK